MVWMKDAVRKAAEKAIALYVLFTCNSPSRNYSFDITKLHLEIAQDFVANSIAIYLPS